MHFDPQADLASDTLLRLITAGSRQRRQPYAFSLRPSRKRTELWPEVGDGVTG
jgi:hypothetical protein